jgi:hypothetical protein
MDIKRRMQAEELRTVKADRKLLTLNVLRSSSGSNDSRVFFILLREKERSKAPQSLEFLAVLLYTIYFYQALVLLLPTIVRSLGKRRGISFLKQFNGLCKKRQ